mmetsp:Transcript_34535/g.95113  ORF Transcript_34535/g.95113 Transcript_34535/m.95113 type:complete len:346 (-) Transcript_34535:167-1204(-)
MPQTVRDHVRHHRARQTVHEHRDVLLKRADKKTDWKKVLTDNKDHLRIIVYGTTLSLASMIPYVIMIVLWFRVYHDSFALTLIPFLGLLVIAALMVFVSRKEVLGIERPWLRWSGALFAFCAIVGCIVGFFLYFRSLAYYWRYASLRSYTNIAAAQNAASFSDANMLLWTEDTHLDTMRSVGYKSKWDGGTYCVAPIVDGTMTTTQPIYYWAVGENCCSARADFSCDDAADSTTRSALVVLEPEDVVRPFMKWAVLGASYPKYERALLLQSGTYSDTVADEVKLVRWVKNPIATMNSYYSNAATRCIWVSVGFWLLLEVFCCIIAATVFIKEKKPLEAALRSSAA